MISRLLIVVFVFEFVLGCLSVSLCIIVSGRRMMMT